MTCTAAFAVGLALLLGGCGRVVAAGGETKAPEIASTPSAPSKRPLVEPLDLVPGDLDLVLRLDVASIRSTLGTAPTDALLRRALNDAGADEATRASFLHGDRVWLATRLADWSEGDRVLVVESTSATPPPPASSDWTRTASPTGAAARYVSRAPARRNGIAELYEFARARVLVSPVEAASVRRVLRHGPDPNRGDPEARGLISLVARLGRPSRELVARHPSLGGLLAGIERVEAVLDVTERGLAVRAHLRCESPPSARRIASFLSAFRESSTDRPRLAEALGTLAAEANDASVSIRWSVPTEIVLHLVDPPTEELTPPLEPAPALHSSP